MPDPSPRQKVRNTEPQPSDISALRSVIEEQAKRIEQLIEDNKKIKRRLFFLALGSNIRLVLFLIPLVLALIYVLPFVQDNWDNMQAFIDLLDGGQSTSLWNQLNTQGLDVAELIAEFERMNQ